MKVSKDFSPEKAYADLDFESNTFDQKNSKEPSKLSLDESKLVEVKGSKGEIFAKKIEKN